MSRLLSRLIDGDGPSENEALAYIGGMLIGVVVAYVLLMVTFGVSYVS